MSATATRQSRKSDKARRASHLRVVPKGSSAADHTAAEIRARKAAHSAYLHRSLEAMESPEGMARFLIARELNPHLTPLACAAVAMDAPERVCATARYWSARGRRIRKGEVAVCFGTRSPSFNPDPMFAEDQLDGGAEYDADLMLTELGEPSPGLVAAAVETFRVTRAEGKAPAATVNGFCKAATI